MTDRLRLEYVTRGFLAEMRRQFVIAHPGKPMPEMNFDLYSEEQRSALMGGLSKALKASSPGAEQAYQKWLSTRLSGAQ